ncbi:MAG: HEAT repeat domain-containing protein [Proteobacteria bacterium]|nr:HEAT repeat domain-containing protein [Pseudomonadota bacterium]
MERESVKQLGGKKLKNYINDLLSDADFDQRISEILLLPGRKVVNYLFSNLYSKEELVKWRSVTAMGEVVSAIADSDIESARVVMRRLIWNLNDESGGIGWGSPESMAEIIAKHDKLGEEYNRILISYINKNGNYLENEVLQQGVLWGIGRIADKKPQLVKDSFPLLEPYIKSRDSLSRGLAAKAMAAIDHEKAKPALLFLENDNSKIIIYENGKLAEFMISQIVANLL